MLLPQLTHMKLQCSRCCTISWTVEKDIVQNCFLVQGTGTGRGVCITSVCRRMLPPRLNFFSHIWQVSRGLVPSPASWNTSARSSAMTASASCDTCSTSPDCVAGSVSFAATC